MTINKHYTSHQKKKVTPGNTFIQKKNYFCNLSRKMVILMIIITVNQQITEMSSPIAITISIVFCMQYMLKMGH